MQSWELTPEEIKIILAEMIWSFSRVSSVDSCLYAWYLHYIEGQEVTPNAFAQFGTIVHETLELFLKGELNIFNAVQYYKDHYHEVVTCDFPANKYVDLGEKAYKAGLDYFNSLNFDFGRYEVLGVEEELNFKVGNYKFHGFADAIYRDKETGEIILRDHKTSGFKYLKDGSVSKKDQPVFEHYKKQEYLYSIPLIERYGKVDWLSWNMIRDQREIKIPFNEDEYKEAQEWAINNIHKIENELLWLPDKSNDYFCQQLCGIRKSCTYRR